MDRSGQEYVIEVEHLSRRYGRKDALNDVTLRVERGAVFGLVGENGAGKTTLIRHILGALTPERGTVRVFGLDPTYDPVSVLARMGYMSEDRDLPAWMRVGGLMRYTQSFYPAWDESYAERLREQFTLPIDARIKRLSRGELARMGLLIALAHKPELLLLDEPSSGLDPVARKDILAAVVRSVAEEGRTVVFSSHLLDEVERVADHVAMIHQGRVTLNMPMDELSALHHRYVVRFEHAQEKCPALPGVLHAEGEGREWSMVCAGDEQLFAAAVREAGGTIVESTVPSLEAVFVARATQAA